jgi:hypothetical protein
MAESKGASRRRTIRKIDDLRERIAGTREKNVKEIQLQNTFERDIILKSLELMRETLNVQLVLKRESE